MRNFHNLGINLLKKQERDKLKNRWEKKQTLNILNLSQLIKRKSLYMYNIKIDFTKSG